MIFWLKKKFGNVNGLRILADLIIAPAAIYAVVFLFKSFPTIEVANQYRSETLATLQAQKADLADALKEVKDQGKKENETQRAALMAYIDNLNTLLNSKIDGLQAVTNSKLDFQGKAIIRIEDILLSRQKRAQSRSSEEAPQFQYVRAFKGGST